MHKYSLMAQGGIFLPGMFVALVAHGKSSLTDEQSHASCLHVVIVAENDSRGIFKCMTITVMSTLQVYHLTQKHRPQTGRYVCESCSVFFFFSDDRISEFLL